MWLLFRRGRAGSGVEGVLESYRTIGNHLGNWVSKDDRV